MLSKRGKKFSKDRPKWPKYSYITQMYDKIYKTFLEEGDATKITPTYCDRNGKIVQEEEHYGKLINIKITKLTSVLFANETGCNTSQTKDGNCAGEKFLCKKGEIPKEKVATGDHHFTLFPIMAANGETVVAVVIFESKKKEKQVPAHWHTGIDCRVIPERDDSGQIATDIRNFGGAGKMYLEGPICHFLGKKIPA